MSKSKFRISGRFDGVNEATVTIDRETLLISVRPLHRKREYTLPLSVVANTVIWNITKAEVSEKLKAKKAAKRFNRGLLR